MAKKPETIIEDNYCDWLRNDYPAEALAIKLILFAGRGFPDRTILSQGRIFFIEFKLPGEDLDPLQIKWKNILVRLGFIHYVCTSEEQAIKATREYMEGA